MCRLMRSTTSTSECIRDVKWRPLVGRASFPKVNRATGADSCRPPALFTHSEQEHFRNEGSSNVDDRTEHEIYLHPFLRSIQANVATFMCSYNLINNSHSCQNSDLLNGRLKTEMGFQGLVMSDWGAQHSGVASANAGLDMSMPGDVFCCYRQNGSYWGRNLTQAVNNGSVAMSRLDDMATRILAAWYLVGQDDPNCKSAPSAFLPCCTFSDAFSVCACKNRSQGQLRLQRRARPRY